MKKLAAFIFGSLFVLALGFTARDSRPIGPVYTTSPNVRWEDIGNLTATQATLAVGARDYNAVWTTLTDAVTIKWDVPVDASGVEFRFSTDANADAHVIEIWISADNYLHGTVDSDSFTLGTTLTLTGGQQVGISSNVFVDTIAFVNAILEGDVLDSGNDRIAIYKADLRGYKKVVIIATTYEAGTTLHCDTKWFPSSSTSGGLTDGELRASAVSVTTDGLTDTEIRATALPVSLDGPTKTSAVIVVDAWAAVTVTDVLPGTAYDVSGAYSWTIDAWFAYTSANAHANGPLFIFYGSPTGTGDWQEITRARGTASTGVTTTINDASVTAGDLTLTLTSGTAGAIDDATNWWYIKDGTIANSEAVNTRSESTNVVTLTAPLVRSHADSLNVWDQAFHIGPVASSVDYAWVKVDVWNDDADATMDRRILVTKVTAK